MADPFRSSIHSHTNYCDGKDIPEVMVKRAVELGFVSLGISSHAPTWWDKYEFSIHPDQVETYQQELRHLGQVYGDRLEVLVGVEHDSLGAPVGPGYDYVIESVHAIKKDGQLCFVDWGLDKAQTALRECFGGDPYAYAQTYFQTCAAAYEKNPAQIAGHLDLVSKYNECAPMFDTEDPRYLNAALEAMDCALNCGLVPEVNTGAIARGLRTTPYPCEQLLHALKALAAPLILSSDSHHADTLDCAFPETKAMLRDIGFRKLMTITDTGFVPYDI